MPDALTAPPPESTAAPAVAPGRTGSDGFARARIVALVTGLLGAIFALMTPFLPVSQTTAELNWPQDATLRSVTAPLMAQVPVDIAAVIPCSMVNSLPSQGGILLATAPPQGDRAGLMGLFVRVSAKSVEVLDRNAVVAAADRAKMGQCSSIVISSDRTRTHAEFKGLTHQPDPDKPPVPLEGELTSDLRPQVVGIFTDVQGAVPAGLKVHVTVDSRFSSAPTFVKVVAMAAAVLCTLLALAALARLDSSDGRRSRRFVPARWFRPTAADGAVVGVLVLWHFVGANTSDDGYILSMVRVADHAGFMANYFRWYGVPEAPFGWWYSVIELFAQVSTASPWVRLPTLLCGIACWLVISREVAPRLGRAVRNNATAIWTGGLVFLAFWLPFNNGLRSEPIVALGVLLTWCSVERAIGTSRLLPAAAACLIGAFTLAAAPTGLNCVAVLLVGLKPLVQVVIRRRRAAKSAGVGGWLATTALLAPIAAAGLLVLTVVYGDQTFAGIQEANRVRQATGPNLKWYEDYLRYYYLFVETVDGSVSRRFAFLAMLLCLFATLVVLLRRKRIAGLATAPVWRLLGVIAGSMFFMMFNPTKWTHHFGAYAGLAGSLAMVTAVVVSAGVLRSRRNRTLFAAALFLLLAVSFSGINGYWYVSAYGVPSFDKRISLAGVQSNSVFMLLFGLTLALAGWQYLRDGYTDSGSQPDPGKPRPRWALFAAPLTIVAALLVLLEVGSLVKGIQKQYPAYSLGRSNFEALGGKACGLANDILVEDNPNEGQLAALPDPAITGNPVAGAKPVGFDPNGVPDDVSADSVEVKPGTGNTTQQSVGAAFAEGQSAGTGGGKGAKGINGSTAKLPFGLNPAITPVMGSYQPGVQQPAFLTSGWYQLPARSAESPLIVLSAAGRIKSFDDTGKMTYGQDLLVEYGKTLPDGKVAPLGEFLPRDPGPAPSWRNLRVPFSALPAEANVVRIIARDPILIGDQWVAFTPPRVPKLKVLNDFIGSTQPVLLDWAVGLQFPCQRPFDHRDGVAEVPRYRILPDHPLAVSSTNTWQAQENGGPLGFTQMLAASVTLPTYQRDNWTRDWGSLERYDQYYPNAVPARIDTNKKPRNGFWTPGQMRLN